MPFAYTVRCTNKGCRKPAEYKVASRWTDGITEELKTYGLTCAGCLAGVFRASLGKQQESVTARGEVLDPPGIYRLAGGHKDGELTRLPDLERQIIDGGGAD